MISNFSNSFNFGIFPSLNAADQLSTSVTISSYYSPLLLSNLYPNSNYWFNSFSTFAVESGSWLNSSIWYGNRVPQSDTTVLICSKCFNTTIGNLFDVVLQANESANINTLVNFDISNLNGTLIVANGGSLISQSNTTLSIVSLHAQGDIYFESAFPISLTNAVLTRNTVINNATIILSNLLMVSNATIIGMAPVFTANKTLIYQSSTPFVTGLEWTQSDLNVEISPFTQLVMSQHTPMACNTLIIQNDATFNLSIFLSTFSAKIVNNSGLMIAPASNM